MKGFVALILVLFIFEGCSISQTVIDKEEWTKTEFNYDEFQRDKYQCEHESYMEASQIASSGRSGLIPLSMAVNHRLKRYGECMRARGYFEAAKARKAVTDTEEGR
jgi:hypothetical protein